jgi:signal peptidase II
VESIKNKLKNNYIFVIIILLMFAMDRFSKEYVIDFFLSYKEQSYYLYPFLNLTLIWNTGMAFGLFESESNTYHFISALIVVVIVFLIIWLFKSKIFIEKIALSVVIGGALGNLFDRIKFNAVPDFIDLHYRDFHWFVFNVSDIVITIGIILLLLSDILKKNEK